MEFRILGPVEAVEGSRSLPLGGAKQRALLAVLVLNTNRVISKDRLIDALWGERAPDGAAHTIQVFVSQLRKALRADGERLHEDPLVTQGGGYVLRTAPEQVDLNVFEAMVDKGRKALADRDPGRASVLFREALDLWRGPALAGLEGEPFAQPYVARIEDMRLVAVEDRIEADLALGRHAELVGELHALVSEFPLRERLRGQLMLALYRSGRQAEALSAYRDAKQMLAEELGIDPTPDLQRLEGAILRQDRDLDLAPPPTRPAPAQPKEPVEGGRGTRRVWLITIGSALVVVAVGGLVVMATGGSSTTPPSAVAPNSVGRIDQASRELVAAIPTTGTAPTAVVWADGSLWVANTVSQTIARIDPETNSVVQTVPSAGAPTDLAAGEGDVWALNGLDGTVLAIDPRTDQASDSINVHVGAAGIAVGAGAVWVTNRLEATITRIDPVTREVVATFPVGEPGAVSPEAVVVDDDMLWVVDGLNPVILQIDVETMEVVATPGLIAVATDLDVGRDGALWVTSYDADLVSILNPSTLQATTVTVGRGPTGVSAHGSAVWVAESLDGAVSEIDPTSKRVIGTIRVGGTTDDVTAVDGFVWVSVHA
ncbi:MAG: BTAD domain-containing putative transcriptional regulator [Actinomycetota bacterium]